jgi:hypothetical protein
MIQKVIDIKPETA